MFANRIVNTPPNAHTHYIPHSRIAFCVLHIMDRVVVRRSQGIECKTLAHSHTRTDTRRACSVKMLRFSVWSVVRNSARIFIVSLSLICELAMALMPPSPPPIQQLYSYICFDGTRISINNIQFHQHRWRHIVIHGAQSAPDSAIARTMSIVCAIVSCMQTMRRSNTHAFDSALLI